MLGFLLATAHAHLVAERGIDDLVAGAFARALRDPGVVSFAQLLLSMIDARKVRATDVLGLVMPPESPRAQALTEELRDLLRALRLDAEGRLDRPGTASAAPSSLPLFARFARENAEGELIVGTAASGPLSLSAAARGSALRPDEPELLNYLGYAWIDRGERLPEALAMVEKAVAANPRSGAIVDSLGWAHYRLGDYKKAVEILEQAVELEAGDPEINNHLGDAYWMVGRKDEAGFQWRRVLTLKPDAKIKADAEKRLAEGLGPQPKLAGQ